MKNNEILINHKRFQTIGQPKNSILYEFPSESKNYFDFFNNHAKENYKLVPTLCLCKKTKDKLLSMNDRFGVEYHVVICQNCGLIRGKKYFRDQDVADFYTNFFWNVIEEEEFYDPEERYNFQVECGKEKVEIIKKYGVTAINQNTTVLDLGGRVGGVLEHFKHECNVVLADYSDIYLNYAKKKGIKVIKGGLSEVNLKPDIIILAHVMEHWNNFEREIEELIRIQKPNETIIYFEFPGIDSLKMGRRNADLLGDIFIPHVYYFTSYVIEDILNRYGFKKLYLDNEIKGLFLYTGKKKQSVNNYYNKVKNDLVAAENKRTRYAIIGLIRRFLPTSILNLIRKFRKPQKVSKEV